MWAKTRIANSSRTKSSTSKCEIAMLQKVHRFLSFLVRHLEWMMVLRVTLLASCEKTYKCSQCQQTTLISNAQVSLCCSSATHHLGHATLSSTDTKGTS